MCAMWDKQTVLMPVELRFIHRVAEFLEDLREGRQPAEGDSEGEVQVESVMVPDQGMWTQVMIENLVENLPYTGVQALFDLCAQSPQTWVLKADAEVMQGITAVQLRNELAALSKLIRRLFSLEPYWPVEVKKERGSYYYRMNGRVAAWWSDASGMD